MTQMVSPSTEEDRRWNPQMEDVYAELSSGCNSACWDNTSSLGAAAVLRQRYLSTAPQSKSFCRGLAYRWWPEPGFSTHKSDFHFSNLTCNYLYLYYLETSRFFFSLLRLQQVVLICILQMFGLSSRASRKRTFSLCLIKTKTLNFHMEKHMTRSECFYYSCRAVYKVLLHVSFRWHL